VILLDNVTVEVPRWGGPKSILRNQSALFRSGARVSILAPAGSGRTTLARVIGGVKRPIRGRVHIDGSVGWPIGFSGLLNPTLTLSENIAHVAGLIDVPPEEIWAVVAWFCDSDAILERRVASLSPSEKALAAYSMSLAVPTDHLIADDKIMISDERVAARCDILLRRRLDGAGLIFLSRNAKLLERWCDEHYVLLNGGLHSVRDPAEGQGLLDSAAETEIARTDNVRA